MSADAEEIRQRFARVHADLSARAKVRRLVDLGRITEATKVAEANGQTIPKGVIVRLDLARERT